MDIKIKIIKIKKKTNMESQENATSENEVLKVSTKTSQGIKLTMPMAVIIAGALIAGAIYLSGTSRVLLLLFLEISNRHKVNNQFHK